MKKVFYCPICGCELETEFTIGMICPCCGNESGYDDDIEKEDIDKHFYYKTLIIHKQLYEKGEEIPQDIKDYLSSTKYSINTAWSILREKWIKDGFMWKYNMTKNWNSDKAREQLKNIGISI